ncbi:hypothetical protein [Gracilibacillus oryzae]|uniref:hypothetical protein n=1 Tax=Gracilibacillus oryzae TaxID=1672701 RepID=UPI0012972809|nr:hypothetical protein [Gracilibacillus oryzae]
MPWRKEVRELKAFRSRLNAMAQRSERVKVFRSRLNAMAQRSKRGEGIQEPSKCHGAKK